MKKSTFERDYELIRDCYLWNLVPSPIKAVVSIIVFLFALGMFGPALAYDNFGFIRVLFKLVWFEIIGNSVYIISVPFRLLLGA